MNGARRFLVRLGNDESGAALIEYTVVLGIVLCGAIAVISAVGTWLSGKWSALSSAI